MGALRLPSIARSLVLAFLTACSSRQDVAKSIAISGGLSETVIPTPAFDLVAYTRLKPGHPTLTIYLEGDGYAWITPTRISDDPTPRDPIALRMAARDPSPSVAYVARPGHYVMDTRGRGCSAAYWANGRFAPEVIEAEAAAIRALMVRVGATKLRIVGYSGGATVALLLPRYGIQPTEIITVAGVLDPTAWVRKLVRAMVVAASRVGRADFSPNFQRTGAGPDVSFPCWASSNLQSFAQQQEWVKSGISTNRAGDSGERCLRYERTTSVPTVRSCPPVK